MKKTKIVNNTIMLMIFHIAKILFPFVTLPYLTRVLSVETYGVVTYVKTVMTYMQILVDFGFALSATKDIVDTISDKKKMEYVVGDTMVARIILGIVGFIITIILCCVLPILREHILYTILSYLVVFGSIFLMDFLFRGLEKMHIITIRFIIMKTISTILTFLLIKDDSNLLLIPILDILSTFVAIILVFIEVKKLNIKIRISKIKNALNMIKTSFTYFLSNVASTSFNAVGTLIIGIYNNTAEVAYWGVCMQIIGSIQACYTPLSDGIYPEMIKSKNINIVKKIIKIFAPIVIIGCVIAYLIAGKVFMILGGEKYLPAVPIFRIMIPTLFFCFFSTILGWPTLGAIGKAKETTISTVSTIIVYILTLIVLIITKSLTLVNIAIFRTLAEFILFAIRYFYYRKYKYLFNTD